MVVNDYGKFFAKEEECSAAQFIQNLNNLVALYQANNVGALPKPLIQGYLELFDDAGKSLRDLQLYQLAILAGRINDRRVAFSMD